MCVNKPQRAVVAIVLLGLGLGSRMATSAAGGPLTPAPAPDDNGSIVGGWKLDTFTINGKASPTEAKLDHIYFAKDKGFFIEKGKPVLEFTYAADPAQKPAQIELKTESKSDALKGIYDLNGDTLRLCFHDGRNGERPTEFESKPGSQMVLIVLKRDAAMKEPSSTEAAKSNAETKSANNLKQTALAMFNYESAYGKFPAHAIYGKDGKPLLSWRVTILPFIEQQDLYQQFHLDEPWDSEHNKTLLDKMPKIYGDKGNETHYQVFVGNGAAFEGNDGMKIFSFTDGTSNTLLIVEGADTVPWSKPADYEYAADKPLPKLGGKPFADGFHAAYADGFVRMMPLKLSEKTLRALITRAGGESPDFDRNKDK